MAQQELKKVNSDTILLNELTQLIEQSQIQLVAQANSTLTILFWNIGHRINSEILKNKRAEYSKKIVLTLSLELKAKFGSNFAEKNLRRMLQFANQFPDKSIVVTLSRQLSWSHFLVLIPLKSHDARMFYSLNPDLESVLSLHFYYCFNPVSKKFTKRELFKN